MKKILLILLLLIVVLGGGALLLFNSVSAPQELTEDVQLDIAEGSGTAAIAQQLFDAGLIANAQYFRFYARRNGIDADLKAGHYTFFAGTWSVASVCSALANGGQSAADIRVTIREGLTVRETAEVLAEAGIGTVEAYLEYAANGDFPYDFIPSADSISEPASRLEGFLFPDTYMIAAGATEQQVIDMLLAQFVSVWTENGFDTRAAELGLSTYEVITMASIVEKEAQVAADRPIIAGVFYKRLDIGMLLQSCATVQFILGEPKNPLLFSDLEIDNPYNTYMYAGLPPGPIAAPGKASIEAALYPTESDYLYFRARTDGSHRFSVTIEEHNMTVEGDQ
ncbi:MAG: endolytic transglycosylase MltG [Bacillota bacterium]|nr:endolytic transglycosylase MltG [Bacillota bacterium]